MRLSNVLDVLGMRSVSKRAPLTGLNLLPFLRSLLSKPHRGSFASEAKLSTNDKNQPTLNIGLCVSGGPDSMALTYLMKDIDKRELGSSLNLTAFVINHQARPGSGEEAEMVRGWLRNLDIRTEILRIDWQNLKPSELSNFESEARIRRYRCLALAAQKHNIDHLVTAHHRDDQVETTLMRLIRSKTPSLLGLQGIPSSSPIPYLSGIPNQEPPTELQELFGLSNCPQRLIEHPLDSKPSANAIVKLTRPQEVTLHRPLLPYPKTDLVATCDVNRIPYVVDKTNIDPTFTQRNAVRALRSRYKLPRALQHDSILALSERARMQMSALHERSTQFLRRVSFRRFDLGSGTVRLSIPYSFAQLLQDHPVAAANVLQRLCDLVSASEASRSLAPSTVLDKVAEVMTAPTLTQVKHSVCSFVYSKVLFEATGETRGSSVTWRLSRAPFDGNEVKSPPLPFKEDLRTAGGTAESTSESVLWDRRYWVRLHSSHPSLLSMVEIRSYQPNDAEALSRAVNSKERKELQELLRRHAPGKIRYTLPVLTLLDQVVAFPTLSKDTLVSQVFNKMIASIGSDQAWLRWDVSYKVITEPIEDWYMGAVAPLKTQRDAT